MENVIMANIKTSRLVLFLSLIPLSITTQSIMADETLAQASGCKTCHTVEKKVIGPGFKEIAEKYKDDENAAGMLIEKVKNGGSGVWGQMPMPPNAAISDEDIETLVKWILSL